LRTATLAAGCAAAALALAGCGKSDEDKVKETVTSYIDALSNGDGAKACGLVSASAANQIKTQSKAKDCASAIESFTKSSDGAAVKQAFKAAKVEKVKVKGKKATATIKVANQTAPLPLEKNGSDWKLSSVGG
jgi:hypothetical protein